MAVIFDGKVHAKLKEVEIKKRVDRLRRAGITPKLVVILVGDDTASKLYVSMKKKAAGRVGIDLIVKRLEKSVSMNRFIETIEKLNGDDVVHGIMIQLPLPERFTKSDREKIIDSIAPEKDVDGLRENSKFIHPTVKAVLEVINQSLITSHQSPKTITVVGCRGMVGKPLMKELEKDGYEVFGAHSQTKNVAVMTKKANIVISAAGVPNLIKAGMIKSGAVVIDVGAPKGDVSKEVYEKASFVSPVPGGVGPMTISCLLENLVEAVRLFEKKK